MIAPSMRALHVSTNKDLGGGERQILALAAGSRARGVEAVLLARRGGALLAAARAAGLPAGPLSLAFAYDPLAIAKTAGELREGRFDVVHLHDGGAASIGVAAASLARVPAIVHRRIASPLRRTVLTRYKYDPARVARFVCVSRTVAAILEEGGIPRGKIAVVESGIDVAALDALARGSGRGLLGSEGAAARPLLGTVAKLASKKGVDTVIRAFANIRAEHAAAQLVVVGDGPQRESLRSLAASVGAGGAVHFAGAREDGAAILADFDLLLFASELEGSPGVLREAMALGVPIVTVDTPGCVEVVAETAVVVPRGDPVALARGATRLLRDKNVAATLRAAARSRVVANYSIDAMVEKTLAVAREARGG
jgi:glycosyltransferase involved in cell wall biosynthesis